MENTYSQKLRRKLYVKKSLRSSRFPKRNGFAQVAAKAKVATESGVDHIK
jgi:hypothetical protein